MRIYKTVYKITCITLMLMLVVGCTAPNSGLISPSPSTTETNTPIVTTTTTPAGIPSTKLSTTPTINPTATPSLPSQTKPQEMSDLVWNGTATITPLAPIVGDKISIKQSWKNNGPGAIASEFDIKLEIQQGNMTVFSQNLKASQPMKSAEERVLDITPEFVISEPGSYQIVLNLDSKSAIDESQKNNNTIKISLAEVPDLSKESGLNKGSDIIALEQAKKDIEKYRKGDVTISVVSSNGQPRSDLRVEYVQTKHTFLFGVFYVPTAAKNASEWIRALTLVKEAGINLYTVTIPWSMMEPSLGVFNLPTTRTNVVRGFNLAGMGHCLLYFKEGKDTPDYLLRLPFDQYLDVAYRHVYNIVNAYKQDIKIWNVINEPMQSWTRVFDFSAKQTIEAVNKGIRAIRDADPAARVLINSFVPDSIGPSPCMDPYDFLKYAIENGVNFDIIGLQCYFNGYVRQDLVECPRRSLTSVGELFDKYAALGKKIHITELSVPSNSQPGMKGYWDQPWSQDLQAEYLKAAYTLFFSKPQVESITWFNASDNEPPYIYYGGLLDEQDKPKKSYYALKSLIKSWTTVGTGLTDSKGQLSFRGFGGTYEVTVTDTKTGLSKKQEVTVEEQKNNLIKIVFD